MKKIFIVFMMVSSLCLGVEKRTPLEEALYQREFALSNLKTTNNKQKQKTFQHKLAQEEEKIFDLLCQKYGIKLHDKLVLSFIPESIAQVIQDAFDQYVQKIKEKDQAEFIGHTFNPVSKQFIHTDPKEYQDRKTKEAKTITNSYKPYKDLIQEMKNLQTNDEIGKNVLKIGFVGTLKDQKTNGNVFESLILSCRGSSQSIVDNQNVFEQLLLLQETRKEEAENLSDQLNIGLAGKVFDCFKESIQKIPNEKLQSWFESSIDPKEIFPVDEENQSLKQLKAEHLLQQTENLVEMQQVIDKMFLLKIQAFLDNFMHLRDSLPPFLKADCAQQLEEINNDIQTLKEFQSAFKKRIKLFHNMSSQVKKQQNALLDFDRFASGFLAQKVKKDPKTQEYIEQAIKKICQYFIFNPDLLEKKS